jgi:hypothetical protein
VIEAFDQGVGVGEVVHDHVCRLGGAGVHDQVAGNERGELGADLAYKPHGQVDMAQCGAGRDEPTGRDDHV